MSSELEKQFFQCFSNTKYAHYLKRDKMFDKIIKIYMLIAVSLGLAAMAIMITVALMKLLETSIF